MEMLVLFNSGCLKNSFKTKVMDTKNNCTLPWIQSMVGDLSYENAYNDTCKSDKDFYGMFLEGFQFCQVAAQYNNTECPGIICFSILLKIFKRWYRYKYVVRLQNSHYLTSNLCSVL